MPILSVFAPLLKSHFFGFYVNGVTLADGTENALPFGEGGPLAVGEVFTSSDLALIRLARLGTFPRGEGFVAIRRILCYTTLCNGFTPFVLLAYYFTK